MQIKTHLQPMTLAWQLHFTDIWLRFHLAQTWQGRQLLNEKVGRPNPQKKKKNCCRNVLYIVYVGIFTFLSRNHKWFMTRKEKDDLKVYQKSVQSVSCNAVCCSDVAETMRVSHVCGIYDSFQTRRATPARTMHYLNIWWGVFSPIFCFLFFHLWHSHFSWGAKTWLRAGVCKLEKAQGGAPLCVAESYTQINLCKEN